MIICEDKVLAEVLWRVDSTRRFVNGAAFALSSSEIDLLRETLVDADETGRLMGRWRAEPNSSMNILEREREKMRFKMRQQQGDWLTVQVCHCAIVQM